MRGRVASLVKHWTTVAVSFSEKRSLPRSKAPALPRHRTGRPPLPQRGPAQILLQSRTKVPCKSINSMMREPRLERSAEHSRHNHLRDTCCKGGTLFHLYGLRAVVAGDKAASMGRCHCSRSTHAFHALTLCSAAPRRSSKERGAWRIPSESFG